MPMIVTVPPRMIRYLGKSCTNIELDLSYVKTPFQAAYDNHMALIDFFEGFPEYKDNDFYVTGESYTGIYIPTLSVRLMNDPEFNFKVSIIIIMTTNRRRNTYVALPSSVSSSVLVKILVPVRVLQWPML